MKTQIFRLIILLVILSITAFAQTSRGTVSGIVADQTAAVIPGAAVTLTNTETGLIRTTVTNGEGIFRFDAVELGTYSVKVSANNFGTVVKNNLVVSANQITQVDTQLLPGSQELAVDVMNQARYYKPRLRCAAEILRRSASQNCPSLHVIRFH